MTTLEAQHDGDGHDDEQGKAPPQSERLVRIAQADYTFGQSVTGEVFALPIDGPKIARMFRGATSALRARLAAAFLDDEGRPPTSSALADALGALEGLAMREDPTDLHLRVGKRPDGQVVFDLGREDGHVVLIGPGGWRVVDDGGIVFRRTALTAEAPIPERGGDLDTIGELVNVAADDVPLLLAWCVATFLPEIPHPIVLFTGEQGVGKTVAARTLVGLLDPSPAPVRTAPKDVEQWAVSASGSWLVALDNISSMREWMSDALCRAATGDGMVRRMLYANSDVSVLTFKRCVLLTSIDAGALRGDLAERLVVFDLERLGDRRRTEADIVALTEDLAPRLLGALLDLTVQVMAVLPNVVLDELPRMADFAQVVAAADAVLGTDALGRYVGQSDRIARDVLESDPLAALLMEEVDDGGALSATSEEIRDSLLDRLGSPARPPAWFPKNARVLSGQVKRLAPALRDVGMSIEFDRTNTARLWTIHRDKDGSSESASLASPPSPAAPTSDARDASDATNELPSLALCPDCGTRPAESHDHDSVARCVECVSWNQTNEGDAA